MPIKKDDCDYAFEKFFDACEENVASWGEVEIDAAQSTFRHGFEAAKQLYDRQTMVRKFMSAMEQATPKEIQIPADDIVRFRMRIIAEEFFELLKATFGEKKYLLELKSLEEEVQYIVSHAVIAVDLPEWCDATVDLDYVVDGARITFGIDVQPLWLAVQAANMAKVGGPVREDGKRGKPPGWKPADIAGLLRAQNWDYGGE